MYLEYAYDGEKHTTQANEKCKQHTYKGLFMV